MSFFTWNEKYATGIQSIDNDHRKLVQIIDELFAAMSKGEAANIISDIVNRLADYTRTHFKREEMMMKSVGYADFESHLAIHKSFIAKVDEFKQKLKAGNQNFSVEVAGFLRDWLINHIQNTDMQYVDDFKKSGLS